MSKEHLHSDRKLSLVLCLLSRQYETLPDFVVASPLILIFTHIFFALGERGA
jgi:hypothetical protein